MYGKSALRALSEVELNREDIQISNDMKDSSFEHSLSSSDDCMVFEIATVSMFSQITMSCDIPS